MTENEAWALYKKRRKKRMDDREGRWVTTENNHKVHIGGNGEPDKGNPRVLEMMTGKVVVKKPETYKSLAKGLNNLDKKGIVARAKKDPEFKELVDGITLYTQGAYGYQKKLAREMVENGLSDKDDETVGSLAKDLDDDGFIKQLWSGQKLFESQSSVKGGVASMIGAINNADEDSPELYRLADDRGYGSLTKEKLYIPPKVGEKIKMDAPTSFTKDKDVLKEIDKAKYGDRIYYTLEPGARSLDIENVSRFKQKESLTCGEFEITGVKTDVQKMFRKSEVVDDQEKERFKGRPTVIGDDGEEWYGPLKVHITIKQVGKTEFGKRTDSAEGYIDNRNHFDDEWKTIKGTHVLIDDYGRISKGPAALKMLDKWKRKSESKKATYELSDEAKPESMDYDLDPTDDFQAFVKKNYDKVRDIYDEKGLGGVEEEFYKIRLARCTKGFRVLSDDEIDKAIKENIDAGRARAWLVEYNHEVKPKLVYDMTRNPEVHNALLNAMYQNYVVHTKYAEKEKPLSFEEFLVTPIKMYRGGSGKEYKTAAAFSSYTFDKRIAERFKSDPTGHGKESDPGKIYEAMIRPIDTFGCLGSAGEMEIFVPGFIAPNGRYDSDSDEDSGGGGHGNTKLPFGLCLREGIEIQSGWSPQDAWKALEGKGYSVKDAYKELKETGKVSIRPAKYERPKAQDKAVKDIVRKTASLKNEQRFIVDAEGNILATSRGDKHSVGLSVGTMRDNMQGNVAVHNHPGGGTFSPDDLSTFGYGARESVVAAKEGTYSLVNAKYDTKDRYNGWYDMKEALEKAMEEDPKFEDYRTSEWKLRQKVTEEMDDRPERKRMREIDSEYMRRFKEGEDRDSDVMQGLVRERNELSDKFKNDRDKEVRRRIVQPFEDFYKDNAEKYGFVYTFTPSKTRAKRTDEDRESTIDNLDGKCYNRNTNFDADEETNAGSNNSGSGGGHGNTRIPYGLCQREGIDIQPDWTPADAWKALEGKGYSAGEVYKELKKTGKVGGKPGGSEKPKKPKTNISINSFPDAMTKSTYMKNTLEAVSYINSHCDDGNITDFLNLGDKLPEPVDFHCRRSSSGEGCALEIWRRRSTGEITKSQLTVPNFSAYEDEEEKAAAVRSFAHEWAHYLDYASGGWGKHHFSEEHEELRKAVSSFSIDKISDEAKGVIKEYNQKYEEEKTKYYKNMAQARKAYPEKKFGADKSKWPEFLDEDGYVDYQKALDIGKYFEAGEYAKGLHKYKTALVHDLSKKTRALMDGAVCLQGIYDSLSSGKLYESDEIKYGHSPKYFRSDPGAKYTEALADYVALKATNPKLVKVFSDNFPEIANALDKTIEDMVKKARGTA